MNVTMLQNQFDTLEEPREALVVDASLSVEKIVAQILETMTVKK